MTEVAVLGAGGGVRAEGAVPAVAGVAVGVAGVVDPAPVGVKRHPGLNCGGWLGINYYLLIIEPLEQLSPASHTSIGTLGVAFSSIVPGLWHWTE